MAKKLLLIYNPTAGKGGFLRQLPTAIDLLVKGGWAVEVYPTQGPQDLQQRLNNLEPEFERVAVAGGDGTLSEAAAVITERGISVPLGYYPVGSTNDVGTSLKIPRGVRKQTEVILDGSVTAIDTGILNGERFVYVAAFGAFTNVSYRTSQSLKRLLGHFAYLTELPRELSSVHSFSVRAEANGEVYEGECAFGMITSASSVGGYRYVTGRNVSMTDGIFEVTLIKKPQNVAEWERVLSALLRGKRDEPLMKTFSTDKVTLTLGEMLPWTRDGEFGGVHDHAVIECDPASLPMMLP